MQSDLQGLEITKGELKHWSGVSVNAVFRPPTFAKFFQEMLKTLLIMGLISVSYFLLLRAFPEEMLLILTVHIGSILALVLHDARKIFLSNKNQNFIRLTDDVDRHNAVIRAIDINDQIEAAGNPGVNIRERDKVIQALHLTREDLIRALKTERILRENENFMRLNPQLFDNNLMALAALQVSDRASEHGRLLNEALQIAVEVQEEMRQLQNRE